MLKQDEDGNTPLHVAILHGNEDVLNELTSIFNFQLGLRNKNGLNAIQLAVQMNDFRQGSFLRNYFYKDPVFLNLINYLFPQHGEVFNGR